jgi:hypothetical protein
MRSHLYLWAGRNVIMQYRTKNQIFKELRQGYDENLANSQRLLDNKSLAKSADNDRFCHSAQDLCRRSKELIGAYRKHMSNTNTTNTEEIKYTEDSTKTLVS